MKKAFERKAKGEVLIVPIFYSASDWNATPIKDLQGLPDPKKPIQKWKLKDEAWLEVTQGFRRLVKALQTENRIQEITPPTNLREPALEDPNTFVGRQEEKGCYKCVSLVGL